MNKQQCWVGVDSNGQPEIETARFDLNDCTEAIAARMGEEGVALLTPQFLTVSFEAVDPVRLLQEERRDAAAFQEGWDIYKKWRSGGRMSADRSAPQVPPPLDQAAEAVPASTVERVARAIWEQRRKHAREQNGIDLEEWGDGSIPRANGVMDEASAAMEAMPGSPRSMP